MISIKPINYIMTLISQSFHNISYLFSCRVSSIVPPLLLFFSLFLIFSFSSFSLSSSFLHPPFSFFFFLSFLHFFSYTFHLLSYLLFFLLSPNFSFITYLSYSVFFFFFFFSPSVCFRSRSLFQFQFSVVFHSIFISFPSHSFSSPFVSSPFLLPSSLSPFLSSSFILSVSHSFFPPFASLPSFILPFSFVIWPLYSLSPLFLISFFTIIIPLSFSFFLSSSYPLSLCFSRSFLDSLFYPSLPLILLIYTSFSLLLLYSLSLPYIPTLSVFLLPSSSFSFLLSSFTSSTNGRKGILGSIRWIRELDLDLDLTISRYCNLHDDYYILQHFLLRRAGSFDWLTGSRTWGIEREKWRKR